MEDKKKTNADLEEISELDEDMDLEEAEEVEEKEDDSEEVETDEEDKKETKKKKDSKKDEELLEDEEESSSLLGKILIALIVIAIVVILLLKGCSGKTKQYQVTFDTNGGSTVSSVKVDENGKVTKPADPTKEGYIFEGWFYNDEKFDFNTKITKDMKLDARWTKAADENVAVDGVTLNQSSLSLAPGNTAQLVATVSPENANDKSLTWTSSNEGVVTVDENGNITALKEGTATITVTTKDGGYTATCTVTVSKGVVAVTGIGFANNTATVITNYTITLKATISPSDATNKNITWSSSDTSIATVNQNGVVTGKKAGKVTITAKTVDGGYTATVTVTVKDQPVTGVSISGGKSTMTVGDKGTLKATVKPSNATNKKVTWSSDHNNIVSVDSKGNIKALAPGTATITVTTVDGKKTATFKITVKEKAASYVITLTPLVGANGDVAQYEVAITKDGKPLADTGYKKVVFTAGSETITFRTGNPSLQHGRFSNTGSITKGTITLADGKTSSITIKWGKDKNRES